MKVVAVDNYARETVADILVAENLSQEEAEKIKDDYNHKQGAHPAYWAIVFKDDYVLSRGMEDLV